MANYTAADVKRLRELTGSGMMDCKNALTETDGDFDKAVELLRIKGAKDVGKRAERSTAEGLVIAKDGVMIELNAETDFVAKNAEFQALADTVVTAAAAAKPADLEALKAVDVDGKTVDALVQELSAKIGEKLELRRVVTFDGAVATYLHKRASDLPPAVGVLVEFTGEGDAAAEAAREGNVSPLAGIDSVMASQARRARAWATLAARLDKAHLASIARVEPMSALPRLAEDIVAGRIRGRVVIDVRE